MSSRPNWLERRWRAARLFFVVWPIWILMIFGVNVWHDAQAGRPFSWQGLMIAAAMLAFGGMLFLIVRSVYRFAGGFTKADEPRL